MPYKAYKFDKMPYHMNFKNEFLGCYNYILYMKYILNNIKSDKKYSNNPEMIFLIRTLQYIYMTHKQRLYIIEWKIWFNKFLDHAGSYWFFSQWQESRAEHLRACKNILTNLKELLNIEI